MNTRQTDEFVSRFDPPTEEPEPVTRLIDVHIYDLAAESAEIPIVESQLEDQPLAADEQDQLEPARTRWSRRYTVPLLALVCLALLSMMLAAVLSPLLTRPVAIVTI